MTSVWESVMVMPIVEIKGKHHPVSKRGFDIDAIAGYTSLLCWLWQISICHPSSGVEHTLGKGEVGGSNPLGGSFQLEKS